MPIYPDEGGSSGPISPEQLPPNINGAIRYVSPDGDDSNDGDDWSRPLQYLKTAWESLYPSFGGTIFFADNTEISADGKGIHIGQGTEFGLIADSVQSLPIRVVGVGEGSFSSFATNPPVNLLGGAQDGSADMDDPLIWISDSVNAPMSFENIQMIAGLNKSIRIGWDYPRDADGEIIKPAVDAASRANGETEFTVTPYDFVIDKISRASNIVSVAFKLRATQASPMIIGAKVYVDFTGAEFTPVAATVTNTTFDGMNVYNVVQFPSVGANFSTGAVGGAGIGFLYSTCVLPLDYITVYGGVTEFPASTYKVLSSEMVDETEGTITVTDYYGYAPRSATASDTDIGTYAFQDRFNHSVARLEMINIGGSSVSGDIETEDFKHGPTMDVGSTIFTTYSNLMLGGYNIKKVGSEYGCRDPNRRAGFCADSGAGPGAVGFGTITKYWGTNGGIVYHGPPNSGSMFSIKNVIVDQGLTEWKSVPAVSVHDMSNSSYLYLEDVSLVDGQVVIPAIDIVDCGTGTVAVNGVYGRIDGTCILQSGGVPGLAYDAAQLPNEQGQVGPYGEIGGQFLAGRHVSLARSGAPNANVLGGNYANQDSDDWITNDVTLTTTGIRDPFGGTRAVRITGTGTGAFVTFRSLNSTPSNDGDLWFGAIWMRRDTAKGRAVDVLVTDTNDNEIVYLNAHGYYPVADGTAGEWEPVNVSGFLSDIPSPDYVDNNMIFTLIIGNGEHVDVYLPSLWYNPVADRTDKVTSAEIGEILTHQAPAPSYLLNGHVGTPIGVKVFAAGGLGTDSDNTKTAGIGSGQLTLTGSGTVYLPVYDLDGTTVIGWTELLQATVNP